MAFSGLLFFLVKVEPRLPPVAHSRYKVCRRKPWMMPTCAEEALRKRLRRFGGIGAEELLVDLVWRGGK